MQVITFFKQKFYLLIFYFNLTKQKQNEKQTPNTKQNRNKKTRKQSLLF